MVALSQRLLRQKIAFRMVREYVFRPRRGIQSLRAIQAYRHAQEELRSCDYSQGSQLELAARRTGYTVPEIQKSIEQWMEREPLSLLRGCIYGGVSQFLQVLNHKKILCGVFSDYPAEKKLDALGIFSFFAQVSCAGDAGWLKPNPRGILDILDKFGVPPDRAVLLGDRQIDRTTSSRAGMQWNLIEGGSSYTELLGQLSRSELNTLSAAR